jgi:hypothetical protein
MNSQKIINWIERFIALVSGVITIYLFVFIEKETFITLRTVFVGISAFFIGLSVSKKQAENTIIDYASRYRIICILIGSVFIILPIGLDILLGVQKWQAINAENSSMGAGIGGFFYVFGSVIVLGIIYTVEYLFYETLNDSLAKYYEGRIDFQNKKTNNFPNSIENKEDKEE